MRKYIIGLIICLVIGCSVGLNIAQAQRISYQQQIIDISFGNTYDQQSVMNQNLDILFQKLDIVPAEISAYHQGKITFTGTEPKKGTLAVNTKLVPMGTKIYVPEYGWGISEDRCPYYEHKRIFGIDVYEPDEEKCKIIGRSTKNVIIVK